MGSCPLIRDIISPGLTTGARTSAVAQPLFNTRLDQRFEMRNNIFLFSRRALFFSVMVPSGAAQIGLGYGPNLFYYLRHDTSGSSKFGTISTSGAVPDRFGWD